MYKLLKYKITSYQISYLSKDMFKVQDNVLARLYVHGNGTIYPESSLTVLE